MAGVDVQATFFATLIDEWVRCGVTDAVISPGHRSSLFAAQLAADSRLRVHVIVDERCASFFALGLGLATGRPAVFWCTSGTATAEAHAAVVEAHHAQAPLLVCTANRPPELQHARDWQSIDQSRLYEGITRWHFEPGVATEAMKGSWRSIAARAVAETTQHPQGAGPVHLDLAIREPWTIECGELPPGRKGDLPWHSHHKAAAAPPAEVIHELARSGRKGVIVAGRTPGGLDAVAVHACAEALGWPVLADVRSGCRIPASATVSLFDALLRCESFAGGHRPEVVLRVGTPVLSKQVPAWLRAAEAEEWLVDPHDVWAGSAADATNIVRADPSALCRAVAAQADGPTAAGWLDEWQQAETLATRAVAELIDNRIQVSEPGIARYLAASVPEGASLFVATSMPVRDLEWYGAPRAGLKVYANRGASGMDGITSTAAAIAVATRQPAVLLVGDLSFLYDLNALWATGGTSGRLDLTIVVQDNNGGGIFSMFPSLTGLGAEIFERVVATPQEVNIPAVAQALGVKVEVVSVMGDLAPAVQAGIDGGGLAMVYVRTDRSAMHALRDELHQAVATAVTRE